MIETVTTFLSSPENLAIIGAVYAGMVQLDTQLPNSSNNKFFQAIYKALKFILGNWGQNANAGKIK